MKPKATIFVSRILPLVLIAVMALSVVSCGTEAGSDELVEKTFLFEAYDLDGTKLYGNQITTVLPTVGEALVDKGLITGTEGQYGLYVESVCGVVADYNTDRTYWAFYIDEEYAMTGVEKTAITNGETYILRRLK